VRHLVFISCTTIDDTHRYIRLPFMMLWEGRAASSLEGLNYFLLHLQHFPAHNFRSENITYSLFHTPTRWAEFATGR